MIDHHDLSGFENPWAAIETICNRETRPQLLINTLNRLRTLDFSQNDGEDEGEVVSVCSSCKAKRKTQKEKMMDSEELIFGHEHNKRSDNGMTNANDDIYLSDVSIDSSLD